MRLTSWFLCLLLASRAFAADAPAPISAAERREQLAKLSEDLNSPDSLRRMASLDAVLHGNDPLAREIAVEAALGSSDPVMRNYAARLLLAKTQLLDLDLSLPSSVQAELTKAGEDADAKQKVYTANDLSFRLFQAGGGHITFQISHLDLDSGTFGTSCQGQQKDGPAYVGQISGSKLQMRGRCSIYGHLDSDCSVSLDLKEQGNFVGSYACVGYPQSLPATVSLH